MKLIAPLLALTLAVSVSAQTTPTTQPATTTAAKPAAKSTTTATAAHPATTAAKATPHSTMPVVHGLKHPLFSLSYVDTVIGTGPLAQSSVLGKTREDSHVLLYTVKYTGWLAKDGTKFDSSFDHPNADPITFPQGVHQVIPGWDSGFEGMHIGGKRRIYVPWQLAYGEQGRPPVIPAKADLIFDVELVGVKPYVAPPPAAAATKPNGAAPSATAPAAKPATPAPAAAPAAAPAKPESK